jgi:hypothetical protein
MMMIFIMDLTDEEEKELIKLREREKPRLLHDTEDLYWFIVSHRFGKIIEEYEGAGREAEYIDALVRYYDGTKEVQEEYYIYC